MKIQPSQVGTVLVLVLNALASLGWGIAILVQPGIVINLPIRAVISIFFFTVFALNLVFIHAILQPEIVVVEDPEELDNEVESSRALGNNLRSSSRTNRDVSLSRVNSKMYLM